MIPLSRILLVDDAASLVELFGQAVRDRLGHDVTVLVAAEDVPDVVDPDDPFDLAIVDLSFPQERLSGLDVLAELHARTPSTVLAIMTQGDEWVAQILRDAWELLPVASVVSKTAPLDYQLDAIDQLLRTGEAPIDPAIQPLLPRERPPWRTAARFGQLIQHQGHAKVWSALMDDGYEATYKAVADRTGLKLNTVKNYRTQLLPELGIHGLTDPPLREMQRFAIRCRAFLEPFVDAALGDRDSRDA